MVLSAATSVVMFMAFLSCGFNVSKTTHAMGSGTGLASGFGKLGQFGLNRPVLSVCGDSTFFHTGMPALANAIHQNADLIMVILDNSGTAMTGFQPHPGLTVDAVGKEVPGIDIAAVSEAMGAKVKICDPFDIEDTRNTLLELLRIEGVKVLVLKQMCVQSPEKKGKKKFEMSVDEEACLGENCGCNHMCTRIFRCPALFWDESKGTSRIDDALCAGCGVCASVCFPGAIRKKEVA